MCNCFYTVCCLCFRSDEIVHLCKGEVGDMSITTHSYIFWRTHMERYGVLPMGLIKVVACSGCVDRHEINHPHEDMDLRMIMPAVVEFYKQLASSGMMNIRKERDWSGSLLTYDYKDRLMDRVKFVRKWEMMNSPKRMYTDCSRGGYNNTFDMTPMIESLKQN